MRQFILFSLALDIFQRLQGRERARRIPMNGAREIGNFIKSKATVRTTHPGTELIVNRNFY